MTNTNQRAGKNLPSWRWNNIPLPEPHIAGILASTALHLARSWRLPGSKQLYKGAGWGLLGAGVVISASAVRAASDVDLERPSTLISTGPYAISRNPMYVGWTLLYLGGALITRNAWMVVSLPVVTGLIHRDILREEHTLEGAFGEEYVRYRMRVRRYL
jgi:protein-S-isoprenylcysteine O-methyltransferase Ste14